MSEKQLMTRPMSERRQEPQGQEVSLADTQRQIGSVTQKDFYDIGGGEKRPGAKVARLLADRNGISTEILEYGKDNEKAWAKVRASNGKRSMEKAVVQLYVHIKQKMVLDAMSNGMYVQGMGKVNPEVEMGPDGFPFMKNPRQQLQLMKNFLAKISILERDTAGKAERNAILALLGKGDDSTDEHEDVEEDEGETPTQEAAKPKEKTPLELAIDRVRDAFMQEANNDRDLAMVLFSDMVKEAKIEATRPVDLKTIEQAEAVLLQLKKYKEKTDAVRE